MANAAERLGERRGIWSPSAWRGSRRPWRGRWRRSGRWQRRKGPGKRDPQRGGGRSFWLRVRDFAVASGAPVILRSDSSSPSRRRSSGTIKKWAQAAGIGCAFIGHAGNGILTSYILDSGAGRRDSVVDLIGRFTAEAVKHGGNLIVEAAPRDLKEKVSVWGQPRSDYGVMRRLKGEMDPVGILNPGRFVGGI